MLLTHKNKRSLTELYTYKTHIQSQMWGQLFMGWSDIHLVPMSRQYLCL